VRNEQGKIMNTTHDYRNKMHPLLWAAALAVILLCLVGTAAIMGWLPDSNSGTGNLTAEDRALLAEQQLRATQQPMSNAATLAAPPAATAPPPPLPKAVVKEAPVRVAQAETKPKASWCSNCGNIESIREIKQRAQGSGLGAAGGAVLGGLLGNQIGGGSGKQIATVAGAVGGAVVGNQVEGNMKASTSYEVKVRLDDGSVRVFNLQNPPAWRHGQRVKVVNGRIRAI
jgi:outer membrane lipoprotein SlyB